MIKAQVFLLCLACTLALPRNEKTSDIAINMSRFSTCTEFVDEHQTELVLLSQAPLYDSDSFCDNFKELGAVTKCRYLFDSSENYVHFRASMGDGHRSPVATCNDLYGFKEQ